MTECELQLVVDASGDWHRAHNYDLSAVLGYPDPDFDLTDYAVRNLGFVALTSASDRINLRYRVETASRQALSVVRDALARWPQPLPVQLSFHLDGWVEQVLETPQQAALLVEQTMSLTGGRGHRDPFQIRPKPLAELAAAGSRLSTLFQVWQGSLATVPNQLVEHLRQLNLLSRTIVVEVLPRGETMLFGYVGLGYRAYGADWPKTTLGERIENQPDGDYGHWLQRIYRQVLADDLPRFDHVDAVIRSGGSEPRRSRYQRLLLPWHTVGGRPLLSCTSLLTNDVDIPLVG